MVQYLKSYKRVESKSHPPLPSPCHISLYIATKVTNLMGIIWEISYVHTLILFLLKREGEYIMRPILHFAFYH